MKKFLPYILILTIIVQLFAPFSVNDGSKIEKAEANADCKITNDYFTNPFPNNVNTPRPETVTYNLETTNCIGKVVSVDVVSFSAGGSSGENALSITGSQITNDNFSFILNTGENKCDDPDCNNIRLITKIYNNKEVLKQISSNQSLRFKCTNDKCNENNNEVWSLSSAPGTEQPTVSNCKITDVLFSPQTVLPNNRPEDVTLWVNTSDCQGQLINIKLSAVGGLSGSDNILTIPRSTITLDSASYKLKTGEKYCKSPDCDDIRVHIEILEIATGKVLANYASGPDSNRDRMSFNCTSKDEGRNTVCDQEKKWAFESSTGGDQTTGSSSTTTVYYYDITSTTGVVTQSAPFTKEETCIKIRDERAKKEEAENSGIIISECTSKVISTTTEGTPSPDEAFPACSIWDADTYVGCLGIGLYYLLYRTTSWFFAGAGKLLDMAVYFSVQDSSYRSEFVVEGWGLVRDFCNMFFIFILLYIAFGTILNLHSVKTKEMIINVIIIGLLINFSLFATQVIIDASNIITRVFYNPQTIVTGSQKDANGNVIGELGPSGEIKLSEAIVNKIDPQQIVMRSQEINNLSVKNVNNSGESDTETGGISGGTFIIVVLLTTVINVVGIIAFLSSGIIFITRVIGLWFAMILAPLAFLSYTVPALQDIKMIGWKHWWPDTLKMAFLAPIFMFFMYILVKFMGKGLGVFSAQDKTGMAFIISIVIPFVAIMAILMKAKDTASDMSGELGKSITGAITKYGGMAVGAGLAVATGGAAMALRGTIGAGGSALANNKGLAAAEAKGGFKGWGAKQLRNIGGVAGKGSMDLRGVKIAGKGLSDTGMKVGKAKEGGFDKYKEEKDKSRKDRAEKIKTITTKAEQKNVTAAQIDLKETMLERKPQLDTIDKLIAKTRQEMTDANNGKDEPAARAALAKLKILQTNRDTIRNSRKDIAVDSTTGVLTIGTLDVIGKTIADAEKAEAAALHKVSVVENKVLNDYANSLTSGMSKTISLITSLGQDRASGIEKTALDIRAGKKVEKDKGDVGH